MPPIQVFQPAGPQAVQSTLNNAFLPTHMDTGPPIGHFPSPTVFTPIKTVVVPPFHASLPLARFDAYAARVNPDRGTPGQRISGIEEVHNGRRVRYRNGAIYERAHGEMAWVHGIIGARYDQLGGASSWLGLPTKDEAPMPEGGRASLFERGTIYWWPDVGAIELNKVLVHYTGIVCFGETDSDQGSNSDEPYVIVGVVSPAGSSEMRSQIYNDVDGGESQFDPIEVFRGDPYGLALNVVLMEHDQGDPDKYLDKVRSIVHKGMDKAAPAIVDVLTGVPYVGPVLAMAAAELLPALEPVLVEWLNDALGTGDDVLGTRVLTISAKNMVVLAARAQTSDEKGVLYKVETPLISTDGASYKVYFNLVVA